MNAQEAMKISQYYGWNMQRVVKDWERGLFTEEQRDYFCDLYLKRSLEYRKLAQETNKVYWSETCGFVTIPEND